MTVLIRPARSGDADWVVAQHRLIYPAEFGFDDSFGHSIATKMEAVLSKDLSQRWLWIAEMAGQRAGSIALSIRGPGQGFLNFVLVLPDHRGAGLARQLMARAETQACAAGLSSLWLETYSCLRAARNLYRSLGFNLDYEGPGQLKFGQRINQEFWQKAL